MLSIVLFNFPVETLASEPLKIVLRYDDYSSSSNIDIERILFESAKNVGAGVLVGVIPFPGKIYPVNSGSQGNAYLLPDLESEKINLLKNYALEGTIEIAIHGFSHVNNAKQEPNTEFAGLPENIQEILLRVAKKSMEVATGLKVTAFVPPYNQYDTATLKVLDRIGFNLLSAGLAGPMEVSARIALLPGGPYPHRLKDVIFSAVSKGHTDALVVATIHPYDIIENNADLPDFRKGVGQISVSTIQGDLKQIKDLNAVRFISISELFEDDLSSDRLKANLRLRASMITRHYLLPEILGMYPLTGLYYSENAANRIYWSQIFLTTIIYGIFMMAVAFFVKKSLHIFRHRYKLTITFMGIFSLLIFSFIIFKSLVTGFYFMSALGSTFCFGVLLGILISILRL